MNQKNETEIIYEFVRVSKIGTYGYGTLSDYFSKKEFPDPPKLHKENRKIIWEFKEGHHSKEVAYIVTQALKIHFKNFTTLFPEPVFAIIPASTQEKTTRRFQIFVNTVCELLNCTNGYNAIRVAISHESTKGDRNKDVLQYLEFDQPLIQGRNIILFDDVKTTGRSFIQCANQLRKLGAKAIFGVFLGETYSTYNKGVPDWQVEV